MKYVCLGYVAPGKFENMPDAERNAAIDACFGYDDVLRKNGHFTGGEGMRTWKTRAPSASSASSESSGRTGRDCVSERTATTSPAFRPHWRKTSLKASIHLASMRSTSMPLW